MTPRLGAFDVERKHVRAMGSRLRVGEVKRTPNLPLCVQLRRVVLEYVTSPYSPSTAPTASYDEYRGTAMSGETGERH